MQKGLMQMIYTELTKKAMRIAYDAHQGQFDECGVPYVFHPLHLAEQMTDEKACCAALLHDVLEDTDVTADNLREMGMPIDVVFAVQLLTHEEGVDYMDYVRKIKPNAIAKAVKLADLAHNSDLSRLARVTGEDMERNRKYVEAKAILTE